ncbi:MAG: ArnT family glycosyltransferase [Vicinamibacterales bacterium]
MNPLSPGARRFRCAIAVAIAIWLLLRLVYWNGYYTEDSPGYVTDAIWAALGQYPVRTYVNGLNVGTDLPVALPIALFGKSEAALSLWPLACSLLGLLSIATAARIFFGRMAGAVAAFLYATYPGDVFFSTVVMPDAVQSGWIAASIALVSLGYAASPRRKGSLIIGAGMALGICHLARATDVLLVPVGLAAVVLCAIQWARVRWTAALRDAAEFAAGWASIVIAETAVYWQATGDPLLRLRVLQGNYGSPQSIARAGLNIDPRTIPFSLFAPVEWWLHGGWWTLSPEQAYHGLLFCLAVVGLVVVLVAAARCGSPDRRAKAGAAVAAVWLAWPILYHQFGTESLTAFVPMHRLSRQLVVYAPGAILCVAAGSAFAARALPSASAYRRFAAAAAIVAAVFILGFNWAGTRIAYRNYHAIKDTYARIRAHLPPDTSTIVADPGDLCFFDFWMNPLGSVRVRTIPFDAVGRCADMPPGIVLTHSNPGWTAGAPAIQTAVRRLPCLEHPPGNWELLYQGYPERVFRIPSADHVGN